MEFRLTTIATIADNTKSENNSDYQQYVEKIVKNMTADWDSAEAILEVDGETFKAKMEGNRHENDEDFVSEFKGWPWYKAVEGMPPHEGEVILARKRDDGSYRFFSAYCYKMDSESWFIDNHNNRDNITVDDRLYWRYIGAPNF